MPQSSQLLAGNCWEKNEFFKKIKDLVNLSNFKVSDHALDAIIDDELQRDDVSTLGEEAEVLEYYPDFPKGPAILLYQLTTDRKVVHCVWGIPKGYEEPAVLITAYIPDPDRWDALLKERQ